MKKAFTLAEVLITLGIVGVIAAITIPGLMTAYRKKVIETRLVKFYTIINQAIKLAEADYDDRTGWDILGSGFIKDEEGNNTDIAISQAWVEKYIIPYIKSDIKMTNKSGKVQLYFPDGSMVAISGSSWLFYPDAAKYRLTEEGIIDENSATGKFVFTFFYNPNCSHKTDCKFVSNGVEPYKYGWDGTKEDLFNGRYGCAKSGAVKAYCTEIIKQNGWKFPSKYPVKL